MKNRGDRQPGLPEKLVLALCGSVVVAGNVAPTEEIILLAYEIGFGRALALVLESLLLAALVLYFIDFAGSPAAGNRHALYLITLDTTTAYLTALAASAFMLWFFGRFEGVSFDSALVSAIVLAFPGTLGASAGRLLLK